MHDDAFLAAVRAHDAQLAARGLNVWVGAEPTFTDRFAQTPEWLSAATGGDKARRAQALCAELAARFPGAAILRSVGRQYPGEALPRWSLGLYRRRDGTALWRGPPDPMLQPPAAGAVDLAALQAALIEALHAQGWAAERLPTLEPAHELRVLLRWRADVARPDPHDPRLARAPLEAQPIPQDGLKDELAERGLYLFILSVLPLAAGTVARIELPAVGQVERFVALLDAIADAARACALPALVLGGYPPPIDAQVEWTTVTPDPAVIEINTAPDANAETFLARSRATYAAAALHQLTPYRLYYNGFVADSGGGGQLTLGGPSPSESPFFRTPLVLPRLVAFFNRHPSLSYFFSHDYVGGDGQSVRADERGCDSLRELGLTLDLLARADAITPALLWRGLAPFLTDASGNSHRAELNVEKLWNPYVPGRGQLGLVEFRAFRMQHTPERATALACLLRALTAALATADYPLALTQWGNDLHERFALPYYLEQDLREVFDFLEARGWGLALPLREALLVDQFRGIGRVELPEVRCEILRAMEFWPLLGDASQAQGTSRLVDASTARVELRLRPRHGAEDRFGQWQVSAAGVPLPLREEWDEHGPLRVFGARYRSFVPWQGLHPTLPAQTPLDFELSRGDQIFCVRLHEWRPNGSAYPGLPTDLIDASLRRAERLTCAPAHDRMPARCAPAAALTAWSLDLRYLG